MFFSSSCIPWMCSRSDPKSFTEPLEQKSLSKQATFDLSHILYHILSIRTKKKRTIETETDPQLIKKLKRNIQSISHKEKSVQKKTFASIWAKKSQSLKNFSCCGNCKTRPRKAIFIHQPSSSFNITHRPRVAPRTTISIHIPHSR